MISLIKKRHRISIPSDPDIELDLKRLCYRFNIEDERVAILTAVHLVANMKMADFLLFVDSYKRTIREMSNREYPQKLYPNKIDAIGGLTLLKTLAKLGYTLYDVNLELGLSTNQIRNYLKIRGLKWSDLEFE